MKRIVKGKKFDTETAEKLASWSNGHFTNDFHFARERLYRTNGGAFFLVGEGGALSYYGSTSGRDRCYGEELRPMTEDEAREWCEDREIDADVIETIFGAVEEAAAKPGRPLLGSEKRQAISATLDPVTIAAIDADRRDGESVGQVLDRWAAERQK